MAQSNRKARFGLGDAPSPLRRSETGYGTVVLDLVHQAAELFSEIEEQARGAETRAESLLQKLHSAEARIEAVEQSRQEFFVEADSKLTAASRALDRAEREIVAAQDKATAAEVRAELAEIKAREALDALALAEQVIRKQLLSRASTTGNAVSSEVTEPQGA
jgi:chromosome segregation ATPase